MAITAVLAKLSAIYSNLSKVDNKVYGVKNGEFFEVPASGVEEAPIDGNSYYREDAAWVQVPAPPAPPTSLTVGQVRRLITLRG